MRITLSLLAILFSISSFAAESYYIQPKSLENPKAGHIAGSYINTSWNQVAAVDGSANISFPYALPNDRQVISYNPFPSYSSNHGLSEWGMGWANRLQIVRYRELGGINYTDHDQFNSPWGQLIQGNDGYYYPLGLQSKIRLSKTEKGFTAYLPSGLIHTFEEKLDTSRGTYSWFLSQITDQFGAKTILFYDKNTSGRPFLSSIKYYNRSKLQYILSFSYRSHDYEITSYQSGDKLIIDRMVSKIVLKVRTAYKRYSIRWSLDLAYETPTHSIAFYLRSITKKASDGSLEPSIRYSYGDFEGQMGPVKSLSGKKFNGAFEGVSTTSPFYARFINFIDFNEDGLIDIERNRDYGRFIQKQDGTFVLAPEFTPLPSQTDESCLRGKGPDHPSSAYTLKRVIGHFLGRDEDLYYLTYDFEGEGSTAKTIMNLCTLPGKFIQKLEFTGDWYRVDPSFQTKIADVNNDGKPDIVLLSYFGYRVFENHSTKKDGLVFRQGELIRFEDKYKDDKAPFYIYDVNGDTLPDIIRADHSKWLSVHYGTGEYHFVPEIMDIPVGDESYINLQESNLTFMDINRDGLVDLITHKGKYISVYVNKISGFDLIDIPSLNERPEYASYSRSLDLIGSGNDQVTYMVGNDFEVFEFNRPSTGLLTNVDNGQGLLVRLSYKMTKPEINAGSRRVVLSKITAVHAGSEAVSRTFEYSHTGRVKLKNKFLGFRNHKTESDLDRMSKNYRLGDHFPPLLSSSKSLDKITGLTTEARTEYGSIRLAGVEHYFPEITRTQFSKDGHKTKPVKIQRSINKDLCITSKTSVLDHESLQNTFTFHQNDLLGLHLGCRVEEHRLVGAHRDSSYDFSYQKKIKRNRLGQQEELYWVDGDKEILRQKVEYDDLHRVAKVSSPGKGSHQIGYDEETGILLKTVDPVGVVTQVTKTNKLFSLAETVETSRDGLTFKQFYQYDTFGRLTHHGDSEARSQDLEWLSYIHYKRPSDQFPGSLRQTNFFLQGTDKVLSVDKASLFDTKNREILSLFSNEYGLVYNQQDHFVDATASRYELRGDQSIQDLDQLSFDDLAKDQEVLVSETSSSWGKKSRVNVFGQDLKAHHSISWSIENGLLYRSNTLNDDLTGLTVFDSMKRPVIFLDAEKYEYTYQYDSLGRLRKTTLPSGLIHETSYNRLGEKSSVRRTSLGEVQYEYESSSRLLTKKTFKSQKKNRTVLFTYDLKGRIKSKVLTDQEFRYLYDGNSFDRSYVSGQKGSLTSVKGKGYLKYQLFDMQKRPRYVEVQSSGLKYSKETSYTAAGEIKKSQITAKTNRGDVKYDISYEYDDYARLSVIKIGEQTLSLAYDRRNRLESVISSNGRYEFRFDDYTLRSLGHLGQDKEGQWSYSFEFNRKGEIASESFESKQKILSRQYHYNSRNFLNSYDSYKSKQTYSYDQDGSLTVYRNSDLLIPERDEFGRLSSIHKMKITYGGNGRATRIGSTSYIYDEQDYLVSKVSEAGATLYAPGVEVADRVIQTLSVGNQVIGTVVNGVFVFKAYDRIATPLEIQADAFSVSPFGNQDLQAIPNEFHRYAGKNIDRNTGLVSMGKRSYNIRSGQFITPDPLILEHPELCVESPVECNLYSYAKNNPLRYTDPMGTNVIDQIQQGYNRARQLVAAVGIAAQKTYHSVIGVVELGKAATSVKWGQTVSMFEAKVNGLALNGSYRLITGAGNNGPTAMNRVSIGNNVVSGAGSFGIKNGYGYVGAELSLGVKIGDYGLKAGGGGELKYQSSELKSSGYYAGGVDTGSFGLNLKYSDGNLTGTYSNKARMSSPAGGFSGGQSTSFTFDFNEAAQHYDKAQQHFDKGW